MSDEAYLWDEPIAVYFPVRRRALDVAVTRASKTIAFGVVLAAHCALLLSWPQTKPATSEVVSSDPGAGGVLVSLISGRLGMPNAQTISVTQTGAALPAPAKGAPASSAGQGATTGDALAPSSAVTAASPANRGGLANDDAVASAASVGVGYDPWAQASLAPRFLKVRSEPGLWEQVSRCWRGERPTGDVAVTVVLGEGGTFMGAYAQAIAGLALSTSGDGAIFARAVDALRACAPYRDVPIGLASRLTLVVPALGS